MSRVAISAVILIISIAAIGYPVSATPVETENCIESMSSVETNYADITGVVEQSPNGSDIVRISYNQLSSGDRLEIRLPANVDVVRATGFSRDTDSATLKYTGGKRAILEYQIGVGSAKQQYANGSNWLFAPTPTHIGDVGVDLQLKPNGVVGNDFLYIGNYTEYSTINGCHEISVVNAAAGDLPEDPNQILHALDHAANNLNIGHKYEEVTIFLTPGFAYSSEPGFAKTSDAWVTKSTFRNEGDMNYIRMVLHEYVHTRQAFSFVSLGNMSWVTEGSADYFSYQLALEVDAVTPLEYNEWLRSGNNMSSDLTNRSTWESDYAPYARGGVFLAVLDERIQSTSNESLESVFREINAVDGDSSRVLIQRSSFLDAVENASSESVRNWANASMDSESSFNITKPKYEMDDGLITETLSNGFETQVTEKPYVSILLGMLIGVLFGMLPYELERNTGPESEDND